MKTIKAIFRYIKGHHLSRKELRLLDDLGDNIKVILLMAVIIGGFLFLTNLAGCYETTVGSNSNYNFKGLNGNKNIF